MNSRMLEIKAETKLECIRKCRQREDLYEYVTPIHKVEALNKIFTYNRRGHKANKFAGLNHSVYYRAYMKLKERER